MSLISSVVLLVYKLTAVLRAKPWHQLTSCVTAFKAMFVNFISTKRL